MQPVVRNNGLFHLGPLHFDIWAPQGAPRPCRLLVPRGRAVVGRAWAQQLEPQAVNDQLGG